MTPDSRTTPHGIEIEGMTLRPEPDSGLRVAVDKLEASDLRP